MLFLKHAHCWVKIYMMKVWENAPLTFLSGISPGFTRYNGFLDIQILNLVVEFLIVWTSMERWIPSQSATYITRPLSTRGNFHQRELQRGTHSMYIMIPMAHTSHFSLYDLLSMISGAGESKSETESHSVSKREESTTYPQFLTHVHWSPTKVHHHVFMANPSLNHRKTKVCHLWNTEKNLSTLLNGKTQWTWKITWITHLLTLTYRWSSLSCGLLLRRMFSSLRSLCTMSWRIHSIMNKYIQCNARSGNQTEKVQMMIGISPFLCR